MSYAEASTTPHENVARGTLFSLLVIPLGIVAWVAIWNLGWIAGIVAYAIAVGALFFYRFGSGGIVSRTGAVRILLVTLATVLLALFATVVSDAVIDLSQQSGASVLETFTAPEFWPIFQAGIADAEVISYYAPQLAIGLGLALLGCFSTLRGVFREAGAAPAAEPVQPLFPAAGDSDAATVYPNTVYPTTSGPGVNGTPGLPQYGELAPPAAPATDGPTEPHKDQA